MRKSLERRELMTKIITVLLSVYVCLTVGVLTAGAQNKSETLAPNASLPETLAWLKSHIPYSYLVPTIKDRRAVQRQAISHVQNKGCTLTYEVTIETMEPSGSTLAGTGGSSLEQQLWRINLKGLNPRMIRVEPATADRSARIVFTSFDPKDPTWQSKIESGESFVAPVEPNNTIWHSDRMDDHQVRKGFVSWASFWVRDEAKGQDIAAALKHVVALCQ
jgi:hypothetical protein